MNPSYLISDFVPVIIALAIFWWRDWGGLKKNARLLCFLGMIGVINAVAENPGLRWGIWTYNPNTTLGVTFFRVLFETYIYCIIVPIAIGSAAIKFAERQDRKNGKHEHIGS